MEISGTQTAFTTTDATPTVKGLMAIPANAVFTGKVYVKGITDAGAQYAWQSDVAARRSLSAAVQVLVATPQVINPAPLNTVVVAIQGGAEILNVQITPVAGQTIKWYLAYTGDISG